MTRGKPLVDCFIIALGHAGVTKDALGYALLQGIDDGGGGLEVHIGYPHGEHIGVGAGVPLVGVGATTGVDLVEVGHFFRVNELTR